MTRLSLQKAEKDHLGKQPCNVFTAHSLIAQGLIPDLCFKATMTIHTSYVLYFPQTCFMLSSSLAR